MSNNDGKLFAKIATVMSKVRTLEKTGENKFDKYSYVTADAIAIRIGAVMAEVGLAFLPSLVSVETSEYTTQKGGSNFRTVAHFQMTLACTETGATFTSMWSGEAIDRSDKSISKAAVSAVKYYLLKTFLLAGGDEEDADASSPAVSTPANAIENPFENTPAPVLSLGQLKELAELGTAFYGEEWKQQQLVFAEKVSKGAVKTILELNPGEADKLIDGIKKKIADVETAKAAKLEAEKVSA